MEIKEVVIEAIKAVIIPELDEIKKDIAVINARLDGIDKQLDDMNKRFDDMNKRFEDMRTDMNKRFEEHYNFNMKRFDSIELQMHNMLAEIRDIRRLYEKKVDVDEFKLSDYFELLREVRELTALRQRVAV